MLQQKAEFSDLTFPRERGNLDSTPVTLGVATRAGGRSLRIPR